MYVGNGNVDNFTYIPFRLLILIIDPFSRNLLQFRLLPQSLAKTLMVRLLNIPTGTVAVLSLCLAEHIWIVLLICRQVEGVQGPGFSEEGEEETERE
jgi:hypothetical protein